MTTTTTNDDGEMVMQDETYFASKIVDRVACDICNKQVCNKYFLRTHKQKVHGIYESVSHQQQQQSQLQSSHHNQNQQSIAMSYQDEAEQGALELLEDSDENEFEYNEMVINDQSDDAEFEDGELLLNESDETLQFNQAAADSKSQLKSAKGARATSRRLSTCSSSTTSSSILSTDSSQLLKQAQIKSSLQGQTTNKKQETKNLALSQVSSKHAFCDLCRRQFYSKSFLRNHMKKIHCIQLPPDDETTTTSTKAESPKNDFSTSPPQTNEAENVEIGFESNYTNSVSTLNNQNSKFKQQAKLISQKTTTPIISPTVTTTATSANKLIKKKAFNLLNRNSMLVNASLLNCMSTVRVTCNICNKELCNKYFLRQHVDKSHKLTLNEYMEKYDAMNADAYESNLKHNQNVTHQLVRSILINHQNLLRTSNDNSSSSSSTGNKNSSVQGAKSQFKRRLLLRNRKLIRSFQQKKCLKNKLANSVANTSSELDRKRKHSGSSCGSSSHSSYTNSNEDDPNNNKSALKAFILEEYSMGDNESSEKQNTHASSPCIVYLPIKRRSANDASNDHDQIFEVKIKLRSLNKADEKTHSIVKAENEPEADLVIDECTEKENTDT
jgi:hypothetical protein